MTKMAEQEQTLHEQAKSCKYENTVYCLCATGVHCTLAIIKNKKRLQKLKRAYTKVLCGDTSMALSDLYKLFTGSALSDRK